MIPAEDSLLHLINVTLAADWLDGVMKVLTSPKAWMPVYALGGVFLIWRLKWQGVRMLLGVLLLVLVSDQLANQLLKPWINRARPCAILSSGEHLISWIRLPDGPRLGGSFPSSHAMNNFAVAAFFVILFHNTPRVKLLFIPAAIISYTRIYLGLHYPSDVIGGAMIGMILGLTFASILNLIEEKLAGYKPDDEKEMPDLEPDAPALGATGPLPWAKKSEQEA